MNCPQTLIDASFSTLYEQREKMSALAQGALVLMREQRDQAPPSDAELVMEVLLDLLEQRDDLRQVQQCLYRASGLQASSIASLQASSLSTPR